jgi:hypothetical protein
MPVNRHLLCAGLAASRDGFLPLDEGLLLGGVSFAVEVLIFLCAGIAPLLVEFVAIGVVFVEGHLIFS